MRDRIKHLTQAITEMEQELFELLQAEEEEAKNKMADEGAPIINHE